MGGCRRDTVQLTDSGLQVEQPVKAFEDTCDSTRFITAEWGPRAAPMTYQEKVEAAMPEPVQEMLQEAREAGRGLSAGQELAWVLARQDAKKKVKKTTGVVRFDEFGRRID